VKPIKQVLVTGGAGYVGAVLVPKLLEQGYAVKVLDLFIYGKEVLKDVVDNPNLTLIEGDIRDRALLERSMPGVDAVIYGLREEENVTEALPLLPLTDYSKFKAMCEEVLHEKREPGFTALILRPATVCGYSPRLRLDLTVNILTNHAVNNKKIQVFGGLQKRPNINIKDVTDLYVRSLEWSHEAIDGKVFNAGYENHTVMEIAELVRAQVGDDVDIETVPSDDHRSYHISSEAISKELGFVPSRTIEDAVTDLVDAFGAGKIPNPLTDARYYNIKVMQGLDLK